MEKTSETQEEKLNPETRYYINSATTYILLSLSLDYP